MNPDHIDFISAYCDRWCERCPLTHRCSAFTAMAAIAMCEDDGEGLELAFGRAADDDGAVAPLPGWVSDFTQEPLSPAEEAEFERRQEHVRQRVEATSIMQTVKAFTSVAHAWLAGNQQALSEQDDVVREALAVATHDVMVILTKLHRALDGKFRRDTDEDVADDHPVQNDWNGSAKVALISIERSADAWSVLASATGSDTPAIVAAQLTDLKTEVERDFPDAWQFRRPGFDER